MHPQWRENTPNIQRLKKNIYAPFLLSTVSSENLNLQARPLTPIKKQEAHLLCSLYALILMYRREEDPLDPGTDLLHPISDDFKHTKAIIGALHAKTSPHRRQKPSMLQGGRGELKITHQHRPHTTWNHRGTQCGKSVKCLLQLFLLQQRPPCPQKEK